jgi:hypothetical protein
MKMMMFFLASLVSFSVCAAPASPSPYMVSGMLQTPGTTVVKLVQAVEVAESYKDAVRDFRKRLSKTFPGWDLLDVIAAPVPTEAKSCGISI